jgi:hypothetical protein
MKRTYYQQARLRLEEGTVKQVLAKEVWQKGSVIVGFSERAARRPGQDHCFDVTRDVFLTDRLEC